MHKNTLKPFAIMYRLDRLALTRLITLLSPGSSVRASSQALPQRLARKYRTLVYLPFLNQLYVPVSFPSSERATSSTVCS
jgi:hypothetical protein